ncbi:MAG: hypothetical protein HUU29_12740 [Planctomycetaceae bacterium]|nr:hypothetical protein [Planctomycetaceae bacterium]
MNNRCGIRAKRRALTLIELTATLVVMLALTTIVLPTATGGGSEQSLVSTQDTLEAIKIATIGRYDPVKKIWTGGYVQDMGGLPEMEYPATLTDPAHALDALHTKPKKLQPWGPKTLGGKFDKGIVLYAGWRGQYFQGTNAAPVFPGDAIYDKWGNPFTFNTHELSDTPAYKGRFSSIQSMGGPAPHNYPVPANEPMLMDISKMLVSVSGYVTYKLPDHVNEYDGRVAIVRLYEPDPETGGLKARNAEPIIFTGKEQTPNTFFFKDVMIGPRALRVVMRPLEGCEISEEELALEMVTQYINVPVGGIANLHLEVISSKCCDGPEKCATD